ncbi:3-oxoacyl-[acyl-carrier-protein] synthase III C-terminal domain-containing protein [Streptomyces sp. NPDC002763]|uniref:3-oxoacyl-[acyl-carrier-protein] synthase III C-terminal domain-containing protein n=1 Tax=Streptomyces sp. NPDC002763 TaxID=3154427 RepID=UPI0033288562
MCRTDRAASAPLILTSVGTFLPEREVRAEDVLAEHGLSASQIRVFRRLHGLDRLRLDPGLGLLDLLLPAARSALARAGTPERVRYVVYTHALEQAAPTGVEPARALASALGLRYAEAFAVNQHNCAQALTAIDLVGELLRAEGEEGDRALVVAGDRVFSPLMQLDYGLGQLLADGSAACVVSLGGPGDVVRAHAVSGGPDPAAGPALPAAQVGPERLAATMLRALERTELTLDDIDLVIPHNVNMTFWRQTAKVLGIHPQRIFLENIARYSHCFAADPLINHRTLDDEGRLTPGCHYLMAAVGVGGSYAATVLSRPPTHEHGHHGPERDD